MPGLLGVRSSFVVHVVVVGVFWAVAGLVLTVGMAWAAVTHRERLEHEQRLWREGAVATRASLVRVHRQPGEHGTTYAADVVWYDTAGRLHMTPYAGDNARDLDSGVPVEVHYNPADPEDIALSLGFANAHLRQRWVWMFAIGMVGIAGINGFVVWQAITSLRDVRRALRDGRPLVVRVVERETFGSGNYGKIKLTVEVPQSSGRVKRQQNVFDTNNPPRFVDERHVLALRSPGARRVVVLARDFAPFTVDSAT